MPSSLAPAGHTGNPTLGAALTSSHQALVWRVGAVIAFTVATTIALALILAFLKFDQRLIEITSDRLTLVLEEVRRQTETGLTLGLELAELEGLAAALERAAQARDVELIDIWDTQGRILFSTQTDRVGTLAQVGAAGYGEERHRLGNKLLLSLPLTNGFGQVVGAVGVRACLGTLMQALAGVRDELLATATPVVGIALVLTLVTVLLTLWFSGGLTRQTGGDARESAPGDLPPPPRAPSGRLRVVMTHHFPRSTPDGRRERATTTIWRS